MHFFVKFQWIFPGISQNFNDFGKSDVKILILPKNLRKFAEILQNSDTKLLKICLKKMYALNVFGGNKVMGDEKAVEAMVSLVRAWLHCWIQHHPGPLSSENLSIQSL